MNKSLRIIHNCDYRDSVTNYYKEHKLLKFDDNLYFQQVKYIKTLVDRKTPENLKCLVEKERQLNYRTRNQADSTRLFEYPYMTS